MKIEPPKTDLVELSWGPYDGTTMEWPIAGDTIIRSYGGGGKVSHFIYRDTKRKRITSSGVEVRVFRLDMTATLGKEDE